MHTTPLSTLISTCSLNHHLYADDTQLFLSFLPTHLHSSIDHLHNALDRISSWMTANLRTLNSSKTEFLLIGLIKQLAKINNSSTNTTHCRPRLLYLMNTSLFSDQISSVSKSCYCHIRQLSCIRPYLDTKTASNIATSIVHTPSLTTATFFITSCQSLRSPGSNRSRTLLHVLLSKLPNPVTSLPSFGLNTG